MGEKKIIKITLKQTIILGTIFIIILIGFGVVAYKIVNEEIAKNKIVNEVNHFAENSIENNSANVNNETQNLSQTNTTANSTVNFSDGTYAYSVLTYNVNDHIDEYLKTKETNIKFSNGNFTACISDMIINGKYKILSDNTLRCNIINYYSNWDNTIISLEEKNWTIDFIIKNDKKIEVKDSNFGDDETELCIVLWDTFQKGIEFAIYNQNTFSGSWNSIGGYSIIDNEYEWQELLTHIFGTSYIQAGSTFTFNNDKTFNDYVHPVTEGDIHRAGIYTFDGCNKFTLKYSDDPSYNVEIYIMNNNTIAYDDGIDIILLSK